MGLPAVFLTPHFESDLSFPQLIYQFLSDLKTNFKAVIFTFPWALFHSVVSLIFLSGYLVQLHAYFFQ